MAGGTPFRSRALQQDGQREQSSTRRGEKSLEGNANTLLSTQDRKGHLLTWRHGVRQVPFGGCLHWRRQELAWNNIIARSMQARRYSLLSWLWTTDTVVAAPHLTWARQQDGLRNRSTRGGEKSLGDNANTLLTTQRCEGQHYYAEDVHCEDLYSCVKESTHFPFCLQF